MFRPPFAPACLFSRDESSSSNPMPAMIRKKGAAAILVKGSIEDSSSERMCVSTIRTMATPLAISTDEIREALDIQDTFAKEVPEQMIYKYAK